MAKAQITLTLSLFVGVVLVLALAFGLSHTLQTSSHDQATVQYHTLVTKPIEEYVQSCLKKAVVYSLRLSASQGGYPQLPRIRILWGNLKTALIYDQGTILLPEPLFMQSLLAQEITKNTVICLHHFTAFQSQGYTITYEPPETTLHFNDHAVQVLYHMPTTITYKNDTTFLEEYLLTYPTSYYLLYRQLKEFLDAYAKNPSWLNVNALVQLGYNVTLQAINRSTFILGLEDPYGLGNEPLTFFGGITIKPIEDPDFVLLPSYTLTKGQFFSLYLSPNQALSFYDDTALFDITDGWINFTPLVSGNVTVTIKAVNPSGQEIKKQTIFQILPSLGEDQ